MTAGAILAGIPLTAMLLYERKNAQLTRQDLNYYETLQEQYDYTSMFVMTEDVTAGEELTAAMIREQRVQSTEDLSLVQPLTQEDLVGKRLKVSLTKGAAISADVVYEGAPVTDDERRIELRGLDLPQTLRENEFVDIRITFPNGEDYLVVGHKRVYRIIHDDEGEVLAVQMRFLEEELLRYQAACVDVKIFRDTRLYAVQYTGEFQAAGRVFYPVNRDVFRLMQWDPNIVELFLVEEEQEQRSVLEAGLERFLSEETEETEENSDPEQSAEEKYPEETKEPLTLYTGLPEET
ncbi:MAG: SAF domain-containing protein [bacterium]|nr:SAF domain-containing protein [bacterium]MDY4100096.1 SAF domain-containing protein [Lachnospiraceae bacterium]